jgi:hypothetical protein
MREVARVKERERVAQEVGRTGVTENQILLDEVSGWWKTIDLRDSQA